MAPSLLYFNTTIVRFKHIRPWMIPLIKKIFQYYNSTIQTWANELYPFAEALFQYYNSTIQTFKINDTLISMNDFNTTIVRFKLSANVVFSAVLLNFNTTIVRFKH